MAYHRPCNQLEHLLCLRCRKIWLVVQIEFTDKSTKTQITFKNTKSNAQFNFVVFILFFAVQHLTFLPFIAIFIHVELKTYTLFIILWFAVIYLKHVYDFLFLSLFAIRISTRLLVNSRCEGSHLCIYVFLFFLFFHLCPSLSLAFAYRLCFLTGSCISHWSMNMSAYYDECYGVFFLHTFTFFPPRTCFGRWKKEAIIFLCFEVSKTHFCTEIFYLSSVLCYLYSLSLWHLSNRTKVHSFNSLFIKVSNQFSGFIFLSSCCWCIQNTTKSNKSNKKCSFKGNINFYCFFSRVE